MSHSVTNNGASGPTSSTQASFAVEFIHRLTFTHDAFDPSNRVLRDVLAIEDGPARVIAFVDSGVANAWPACMDRLRDYAEAHADVMTLVGPARRVPGGEACKQDLGVFDTVTRAIHEMGICRHSYVIAIGGGAMLDAVGFAAATAHRGVRLVRLPTTTLAQDDAGVGVKNGINAFGKKNFFGAFAPPWAVINDDRFLGTLADRDFRAGLSEAVKVALLKDPPFFDWIEANADRLAARDGEATRTLIERSARLHMDHIVGGGDPFELTHARPLDFGHWAAHKLEQMTRFELRHGEAVAVGLALDVMYSVARTGLDATHGRRILDCLEAIGFTLYHAALRDTATLFAGLDEFREHLGGMLTITLLDDLGQPVDVHEIDRDVMTEAIEGLARRGTREPRVYGVEGEEPTARRA